MNEFWKSWKNITKLEKAAIESLKEAKKIVLKHIPRDKIISIYVGGSFVRRELTEKSDVDVWVITKDMSGQRLVTKMIQQYDGKHKPNIGFSGYSLYELKTGKFSKQIKKLRTGPARWVRKLDHYELIYGKKLNKNKLAIRSDEKHLRVTLDTFQKLFLPFYDQGKLGFQDILKQLFWLVELELTLKGKHPPHSWKEMAKLAPKGHIMHDALKLRKANVKHNAAFITKLKKYLTALRGELA